MVHLFGIAANDFAYADAGAYDQDALLNIAALQVAAEKLISDDVRPNRAANADNLFSAFRQMKAEQVTSSTPFVPTSGIDSQLYRAIFSQALQTARDRIRAISSVYDPPLVSALRYVLLR